jgi:hypothetical protein
MNYIKCKVCGDKFTPWKSNKYEVIIPNMFGPDSIGEAYDCPWCGCQHIVNTKYMTAEEHLKKMSIIFKED